jgi:hypothetical protein
MQNGMAHQVSCLAQKTRERMKNPNSRAEAVYQSPITIAIFFKSLLPFLKQFEDSVGGDGLLELLSKGILRKVYSSLVGVFGQGIGDQLEIRMRNRCMASR